MTRRKTHDIDSFDARDSCEELGAVDASGSSNARLWGPLRRRRNVGIDLSVDGWRLGTVIGNKPVVLPSRHGIQTTPSILSVVRERTRRPRQPLIKQLGASPFSVGSLEPAAKPAFTEEQADNARGGASSAEARSAGDDRNANADAEVMTVESASVIDLSRACRLAEARIGRNLDSAVIAVPAYYGREEREAVMRAARKARIPVTRIVTQPAAAAVAHGMGRRREMRMAVVDVGAGTFSVSVVDVRGRSFHIVANGGDTTIGALDMDAAISDYLCAEFDRAHGGTVQPDEWQCTRLEQAIEECKAGLGVQRQYCIHLPQFASVAYERRDLRVVLTRERVTELMENLLERMSLVITAVLSERGVSVGSIDELLFIGEGAEWLPLRRRIEGLFGQTSSARANPVDAAVKGAAILAEHMAVAEVGDMLPLSIGFAGRRRRFTRLVPGNTPLPARRSFTLRTFEDRQRYYVLPTYQGEFDDAAANEYLCSLILYDIPDGPRGRELELTLAIDERCILTAEAKDVATGAQIPIRLERSRDLTPVLSELGPLPQGRAGMEISWGAGKMAAWTPSMQKRLGHRERPGKSPKHPWVNRGTVRPSAPPARGSVSGFPAGS